MTNANGPAEPPTDDDLARFQLAFTHVLGHPALGAALRHAVASPADSSTGAELDISTSLAQHGIELPWGSTAVLLPPKSAQAQHIEGGAGAEGPAGGYDGVRVCALVGGSLYCVEFHPPVILSSR